MLKSLTLSKQFVVLLFVIALASSIRLSQATSQDKPFNTDMDFFSNDKVHQQRRTHDFNKLRHFLLTSNAEQRAAKREKQDFHKRQLIQEYFQAVNDPDPNRLQEFKKRIKTFCNSYEDIMDSDRATCG